MKWLIATPLVGETDLIVGDESHAELCRASCAKYFDSIAVKRRLTMKEEYRKDPIDPCLNHRNFDHVRRGLRYDCACAKCQSCESS